ncbi:MAG TPA: beta-propeller domain-containing protein [Candidatus Binatia bacterium]|nr:beta-propeller domain-containing protein [Candidatus Binatia bacterium]
MRSVLEDRRVRALAADVVWIAVCLTAIASCSGCSGGGGSGAPLGPGDSQSEVALSQFASCDDLRAAIVADARAKIAVQAERLREDGWTVVRDGDVLVGAPGEPVPAPRPDEGGPQPGRSTDTNVQVPGVDEADVVETAGDRLYLLHGSDLVILQARPPEATAVLARLAIEGFPTGMFVTGDRAAVVSQVDDPGDLGGDDACAWIDDPLPRPMALDGGIAFCPPQFTKLTVVDVANDAPRVAREIYLEGVSLAARRHGDVVRLVVQRGWGVPPGVPEPWGFITSPSLAESEEELRRRVDAWEQAAIAALDASALEDWLPAHRERVAGDLVDVPIDCRDAHVPPPALSDSGATRIVALRMSEDDGPIEEALVIGGAQQVYASADTLLLAYPDWSWFDAGEPNDRTAIHAFALGEGLETRYLASGFVPGTTISQLAFDVRDGVIRVASTVSPRDAGLPGAPPTTSRITTARVDGEAIAVVGSTGDLAPGERIFAARFLGDRGYLVTFRRIDPLFVVDLADPAAPAVLGEVEITGFSEYLHPLDETHLVTVGRDVDEGGRVRGLALSVFDVSEPSAPRLVDAQLLPGDGWSPAESSHLAFTFDSALGIVALPYSRYDGVFRSSLVLVAADAGGLTPLGEVDHGRFAVDACGPGPQPVPVPGTEPESAPGVTAAADVDPSCLVPPNMVRGVFFDDFVYSISSGGLLVNAIGDLAAPVAAVELPSG